MNVQNVNMGELVDNTPFLNKIGIGLLALAKLSGVAAICCGFSGMRILAGCLFGVYGALLVACGWVCIVEMKRQNKVEVKEVGVLEKMLRDGTFNDRLKLARMKIKK